MECTYIRTYMNFVFCVPEVQLYVNKSSVGGGYPTVVSHLYVCRLGIGVSPVAGCWGCYALILAYNTCIPT